MRILANLNVAGTLDIDTVANAGADTDRFLVQDANGVVKYRTGAEVASDIGAAVGYVSTVKHEVKLGEAISKGQAVYVSGSDGTNMIVSKASNASEATSSKTFGLLESSGALNAKVFVITEGLLAGLDTSTATIGDPVWLGTAGNLIYGLVNKPYAPDHLVFIGIVTRVNQNNGEIFIKVQNGFELQELHNVQITSTPANNTVLSYETATSLYKMKSIATLLGYTPADDAGVVHIAGTETITGVKTFTATTTTFAKAVFNSPTGGATGEGIVVGKSIKLDASGVGESAKIYVVSKDLSDTYGSGLQIQFANQADDKGFGFNLNTSGGFELYTKSTAPAWVKAISVSAAQLVTLHSDVKLAAYTTNGFVKTINSDGTLNIDPAAFTLTTNGASGAATYNSGTGVLNIPNYLPSTSIRTVYNFTATAGQTTFSLSYIVGSLDVYYNGSRLSEDEYTATNGTTVVLDIPCVVNDIVDIVAYYNSLESGNVYVPLTRTITINGTTYDLSADRSWTITAGVTGSGTANQVAYWNGSSSVTGSPFFTLNLSSVDPNAPVGDLIITGGASYKNANILINRYTNAWESGIRLQTNGTTDWYIGQSASGSNNDLEFFSYGTSSSALKLIKATGAATFISSVTATSLIKSGGTSSQFLKADGSVDGNTYLTTSSASSTYLPLAGGTLTGPLNGTTATFTGRLTGAGLTSSAVGTGTVAQNASGWYRIARLFTSPQTDDPGAGVITISFRSPAMANPVTYVVKYFRSTQAVATLKLEKYGSEDYITDVRIINPTSSTAYYIELNFTATSYVGGHVFSIYYDQTLGDYSDITEIYTNTLPTGSASGTTLATLPFLDNGTTVHSLNVVTSASFSSSLTANSFVKSGGIASQFLKADGTVDGTTYQTALTNPVTGTGTINYIPIFTSTGSTIGNSKILYDAFASGYSYTIGTLDAAATNGKNQLNLYANDTVEMYMQFGSNKYAYIGNQYGNFSIAVNNTGVHTYNEIIYYNGSSASNRYVSFQTEGSDRLTLNQIGTVRLNNYTTNGFVKFSGGDGTLSVDTNTYLTAESDTLATVTSRGASTTSQLVLSGAVNIYNTDANDFRLYYQGAASGSSRIYYHQPTNELRIYATAATSDATTSIGSLKLYISSVYREVLHTANYSGYALPLTGGTLTGDIQIGSYDRANTITLAANANGNNRINFYDNNNTEGLYIRTIGESNGGIMRFGARWDDDEDKVIFRMYQSSAGAAYDVRVGINVDPTETLHVSSNGVTAQAPSKGWPVYDAELDTQARRFLFQTAGNNGISTAGYGGTVALVLGQYYDSRVVITPQSNGGASPGDQGTGHGKDLMIKGGTSDNGVGYKGGRLYLNGGMGYTSGGYNGNVGTVKMQTYGGGTVTIGPTTGESRYLNVSYSIGVRANLTGTEQEIFHVGNTGSGVNDGFMRLMDNGTVKVLIGANNSRSGDTYFNGGGKFGIGLDTPQAILDVSHTAGTTNIIRVSNGSGNYRWRVDQNFSMIMTNASSQDTFSVTTAGVIQGNYISLTNTQPIEFLGGGNTDTYTRTTIYCAQNNTSNSSANGIFIERGRLTNSGSAEIRSFVIGDRGGGIQFLLDKNGKLTVSDDVVAYGSPSDSRLKTIKEKVPNALDKVMQLNGYRFDWKEVSDITNIKEDVGVIAQEVAEVLPELARSNQDGIMSVRYQGLTAVLIEAVKELAAENKQIKEELNKLKN